MLLRTCHIGVALASLMIVSAAIAEEHTTTMELRHNMPFVQVMVNGKGPFTFSIDTGTGGRALITPALMQQLNIPITGATEIGDPSGLNPRKVPTAKIQSLSVAGVVFRNVEVVQFQPSSREGLCDGILGFVLFHDYLLMLDYPQRRLVLATGSIKPDGDDRVVPFTMPDNVPLVRLGVGSQKVDAHIDSRGFGLGLPEKFAQNLKFVSEPIVIGRGRTVSNEFEVKGAQLAGDVRLGGYTFLQPFVEINPILPAANFGAMAMQNFAITFDQHNLLLRLDAKDKSIIISAPQRRPAAPPQTQPPTTSH